MRLKSLQSHPSFGLILAGFGALAITPDTLFMRLSEMNTWSMLFWRGLQIGGMLLVIWFIYSKNRREDLFNLTLTTCLLAIFCQTGYWTFFTLGVGETSVALVLICLATSPLFAAIFSKIFLKEPILVTTRLAMISCFFGVVVAVTNPEGVKFVSGQGSGSDTVGILSSLLAAIFLGASFVFLRANKNVSVFLVAGIAGIISSLVALIFLDFNMLLKGSLIMISVTGLLILPISFASINLATKYTQAPNIGLLMLLETIIGPVWVWIGVGKKMTSQMIIGGLIVITSLVFYIWSLNKNNS